MQSHANPSDRLGGAACAVAEFQIVVAILLDCLAMLVVALVIMNLNPKSPAYPKYWFGFKKRGNKS